MAQALQNANYPVSGSTKQSLIFAGDSAAADEGNFFVATSPTPGTAIATTTSVVDDAATQSSTHAQASPVMIINNQNAAGSGINIYLRYLKMYIVQVPTSATIWSYAFRLDPLSTKLTTVGTAITPQNVNSLSNNLSKASISFGAITTVIMSAQGRLTGAGLVSGAIPVAQDQWFFNFGNPAASCDSIGTQTLVKSLSLPCSPQIIAPGFFWTLEMWGASNAGAPSWVFELGYIERPQGQ